MLYFLPSPSLQKRKDFFYLKVGGGDRPVGDGGTGGCHGTPRFWQIMPTTLVLAPGLGS